MLKSIGGILAAVGLILSVVGFREGIAGFNAPKDLYAEGTNVSEIGYFDMVSVEVFAAYGPFATRTVTKNGSKESEYHFFVIPAREGSENRYVGIKVSEKDLPVFNEITMDTYEYLAGYATELKNHDVVKMGCLKKMDKKIQRYYYDAIKDLGYEKSAKEMKQEALPYYIDTLQNPRSMTTIFLVGLILFFGGSIVFIPAARSEKKKENMAIEQNYVYIRGISYAKGDLARVNYRILNQEKDAAVQELARITGISEEDAVNIVENWRQYYY